MISGACAAIVGFLYMALFSSGSPQTGTGDELLESIAAVVVGGTSLMGGRGSVVGTFFGALLIGVLYNAMNLLNVDSYLQKVLLGAVILLAVVLDELRKRYFASASCSPRTKAYYPATSPSGGAELMSDDRAPARARMSRTPQDGGRRASLETACTRLREHAQDDMGASRTGSRIALGRRWF